MKHTILILTMVLFGCSKQKEEIKPEPYHEFYFYVKSNEFNLYDKSLLVNKYIQLTRLSKINSFYSPGYTNGNSNKDQRGVSVLIKMPSVYTNSYKGFVKSSDSAKCSFSLLIESGKYEGFNRLFGNRPDSPVYLDWNGSDTIRGFYKGSVYNDVGDEIKIDSCSFKLKIEWAN